MTEWSLLNRVALSTVKMIALETMQFLPEINVYLLIARPLHGHYPSFCDLITSVRQRLRATSIEGQLLLARNRETTRLLTSIKGGGFDSAEKRFCQDDAGSWDGAVRLGSQCPAGLHDVPHALLL